MKKKLFLLLMLVTVLSLTACGGGTKKSADTLRVALSDDATNLDPAVFNDEYSENIMTQVYDNLLEKQADGTLKNALATSVEVPDPKTYIITLREGVKFSNGDPLTPEDVVYSLTRAAKSTKFAYIYGKIDLNSFQIEGNKITFHLKEPDASFKEALSHPASVILSKKYVEDKANDLATKPMGTGPYKMDSWNKNSDVTLSVNDNYWGEKPAIKKIEMRVIPEASQRVMELESGSVDLAYKISPNDKKKIAENKDLQLLHRMDNSIHFVGFNTTKPPFDKLEARQAMTYAIDMKSIFDSVYMGSGSLASSPVNPNFKYSLAKELQPKVQDKQKAKELFAKAGLTPGTKLTIYTNENQQRIDVATMMQAQLKEYGIDLQIQKLEWGALVDALKKKEDNMFIMSWNPSVVDAHYELYQPFSSANKGEGPNYMFYGNPKLDQLIAQGISTVDEAKRAEIYREAQTLVNEECPWMYICYGETAVGASARVKGLDLAPEYSQRLNTVTLADQ